MLTRLDDWLMDRCFQPFSDRMADRCSPFQLAAFGAEIVIWMVVARYLVETVTDTVSGFQTVLSVMIILLAANARGSILRAQHLYRPGARNPLRLIYAFPRKGAILLFGGWTFITLLAAVTGAAPLVLLDVMFIIEFSGWFAFYYFASCDRNPPFVAQEREYRVYAN